MSADGTPQLRNVIAKGMSRFEGVGKTCPSQPDVERYSPQVINILGLNEAHWTLNGTNCYLVGSGKRRMLIDTAGWPRIGDAFERFLSNLDETLRSEDCELSLILITHLHSDHYGGTESLLKRYGSIPVGMLPNRRHDQASHYTFEMLRNQGVLDMVINGPQPTISSEGIVWPNGEPAWPNGDDVSWDKFGRSKNQLYMEFSVFSRMDEFYNRWFDDSDLSIPSQKLSHGDVLRVDGATIHVWDGPGHAENHAVFVLEEEHSIFSGDHVLGFGTTQLRDMYDYMATLQRMSEYRPHRLYPAHGPLIVDGTGFVDRYIGHRQEREDQVVNLLEAAAKGGIWADAEVRRRPSTWQIARHLYTDTAEKRMLMAKENIEKILTKLQLEGRVSCLVRDEHGALRILPLEDRRYGMFDMGLTGSEVWKWSGSRGSPQHRL